MAKTWDHELIDKAERFQTQFEVDVYRFNHTNFLSARGNASFIMQSF